MFSEHQGSSFDALLTLAQSNSMSSQQRVQLIQALNAAETNPGSIVPAPASTIADDYEIMGEDDIASDPPTDASDAINEGKSRTGSNSADEARQPEENNGASGSQ